MEATEDECQRYVRQRAEKLEADLVRTRSRSIGMAGVAAVFLTGLLVLGTMRLFAGWDVDREGLLVMTFLVLVSLSTSVQLWVRRSSLRDELDVLRNLLGPANVS